MHFSSRTLPMKKLLITIGLMFVFSTGAYAQTSCTVPAGFLCITVEAGNRAKQLAQENAAQANEIIVLKDAIKEKDKNEIDLKATAAKNESELKQALIKTQTDNATLTGQIIELKGNAVRDAAIIDILLKNTKKRCYPFSVCIN